MNGNVDTLIDFYNHCVDAYDLTAGRAWYDSAREECQKLANDHGLSLKKVVYIVAALSPQLDWSQNIRAASDVITRAEKIRAAATGANVAKARAIMDAPENEFDPILRGPKVRSFAANILGDPNCVTVDRWAWRCWVGDLLATPPTITAGKAYDAIVNDYRQAAAAVGLTPNKFQAATWVAARRLVRGLPSDVNV